MTVNIRPIVLKDAASYRRCWDVVAKERRYIVEFKAPPLSEIRASFRNYLRKKMPFLVAVDGKRVVGWAAVYCDGGPSVRHWGNFGMSVHPDYRGMGLGTKLAADVLKLCRGKLDSVFLVVLRKNERARKLYKKLGFKPRGGIKNAVKGLAYGVDDTLYMQMQMRG